MRRVIIILVVLQALNIASSDNLREPLVEYVSITNDLFTNGLKIFEAAKNAPKTNEPHYILNVKLLYFKKYGKELLTDLENINRLILKREQNDLESQISTSWDRIKHVEIESYLQPFSSSEDNNNEEYLEQFSQSINQLFNTFKTKFALVNESAINQINMENLLKPEFIELIDLLLHRINKMDRFKFYDNGNKVLIQKYIELLSRFLEFCYIHIYSNSHNAAIIGLVLSNIFILFYLITRPHPNHTIQNNQKAQNTEDPAPIDFEMYIKYEDGEPFLVIIKNDNLIRIRNVEIESLN